MANKKPTGPASPDAAEQQPEAPAQYIEVGQLRTKHGISRAVFAGVCAAQGWKPGKSVTEAEFLGAVKQFTSAPMGRAQAVKKEATK